MKIKLKLNCHKYEIIQFSEQNDSRESERPKDEEPLADCTNEIYFKCPC